MKTTIKLFLLIFIVSSCTSILQAQELRRNLKGEFLVGITAAHMDVEGGNKYMKNKIGFSLGANVSYKFFYNLQVQSGFHLIKKGLFQHDKSKHQQPSGLIDRMNVKRTVDANYVQIPLNLGLDVPLSKKMWISANAGVYGAFGFKGRQKTKGYKLTGANDKEYVTSINKATFDSNEYKKVDYGVGVNVGMTYDIYALRVQYDHGLCNVASESLGGTIKNRSFMLGLGFAF